MLVEFLTHENERGFMMETYPSIGKNISNEYIVAYDKIDGSNIRAEWSRKTGFTRFGSRTRLMEADEKPLGEAIGLFNEKYADALAEIFIKQKLIKATAFLEFYGKNSFAGFHEEETHDVILFDVHFYKQGFLTGKEFLKLFTSKVDIAPVLYEGKINSDFIAKVKNGSLDGMTFEGVVCKGSLDNKNRPNNFKIKSEAWLSKLKNKYIDNEDMFNQLS